MSSTASPQTNAAAQPLGRKLVWLRQALVLAIFWQVCALLSPERASALGATVVRHLGPRHSKHKRVWRNLRLAFPDRSDAEIDDLARDCWGNLGRVMAEYPHLPTIAGKTIAGNQGERRIELAVLDEKAAWRRNGRPAVFVAAHLGNWELVASKAVTGDIPLVAIYSPQTNPLIDRMIQKKRRALGCLLVSKNAGVRDLMRHLEGGRSVGVIADQRIDGGEPLPFFGRPASTTAVPARLALKLGLELVPVRIERQGAGRFRVTAFEAVMPRDPSLSRNERALDMMGQVNGLFESWIRERPGEWNCAKRRWSKDLRPKRGQGKSPAARRSAE